MANINKQQRSDENKDRTFDINKSALYIRPNEFDSHQSKPRCIVKFVTFRDKDSYYLSDSTNSNNNETKKNFDKNAFKTYTVVSDILSATISSSKGSNIMTGELTLSSGDLNYTSILAPGDHCLVWMMHSEAKYQEMQAKIKNNEKSNDFNSGLKFVGRVNSVRTIMVTQGRGIKTMRHLVTLKGFSEFQSMIYYNPLLYQPGEKGGPSQAANGINTNIEQQLPGLRFFARISSAWQSLISKKGADGLTPTDMIPFFINLFLGSGAKNSNQELQTVESPNSAFIIPSPVASLLGAGSGVSKNVKYIDILKSFIGLQKYGSSAKFLPTNLIDPNNIKSINLCKSPLTGAYLTLPDTFSGQTIWQIISNHLNGYLNEMYVTIRSANENGDIFPCYIARQIPLTSQKYARQKSGKNANTAKSSDPQSSNRYTLFSELPRWKIDPKYTINAYNFGTSDALRFNFIQVFGALIGYDNQDASVAQQAQITKKNYTIDPVDIARNGVRMQVLQTNVDIVKNSNLYDLSSWAALIGDFFHNGHLKMNGTISLSGVQEPISIGDNLEIDGKVFHIENVAHSYQVDEVTGNKVFETNIQLTNGVMANEFDDYVTIQPQNREDLPDTMAPGYTDSEITVNNTKLESGND